MAIFTGTPVATVGSPYLWVKDIGSNCGPWHVGGAMYITGLQQSFDDVSVAKSTDGGVTWSAFPNADPDGGFLNMGERSDAVYDPVANKIRWICSGATVPHLFELCLVTFDCNTDTWEARVNSGIQVFDPLRLGIRPNGSIRALYSVFALGKNALHYVAIEAGAFGSSGTVDGATGTEYLMARSVIADASGALWIAFRDVTAGQLYVRSLDSGDTPGTRQTLDTAGGLYLLGNALVWNDRIVFTEGFANFNNSSDTKPVRFFQGSPVSAPSWTPHNLNTVTAGTFVSSICVVDCGSTVKFFFASSNNSYASPSASLTVEQVIYDGGTLGAQATFWDIVANPPAGASQITLDGLTATLNGSTLELVATIVIDGANNLTAVYVSVPTEGYRNRTRYDTQ